MYDDIGWRRCLAEGCSMFDDLQRKACLSPCWSLSSESESPCPRRVDRLFGIGRCGLRTIVQARACRWLSTVKSESPAQGVMCDDDDILWVTLMDVFPWQRVSSVTW